MNTPTIQPNPKLDLVLERLVDVPPELLWEVWTKPEHLKKWFTPPPWTTVDCEIDLRPGGIFRTVMRSPEGQDFPGAGCYLEIVPNQKLVWTSALGPGYRPQARTSAPDPSGEFYFTAIITLEPQGTGTKYTATVIHGDEASAKKHEAMGFYQGWGTTLDQLIALAKTLTL
jgi:uncharacterized protein YndB with AHSA1/START domain